VNHTDHVRLLSGGVPAKGGTWADLGSGTGAFTLALGELIGPEGAIYSVDQDRNALAEQERAFKEHFPKVAVHWMAADFTKPLNLPALDGIVMANSLHFHRDKDKVLKLVKGYLKPGGRLLLVEYNVDNGNMWVPHPLSFGTWEDVARRNGFKETRLLDRQPSRFLKEMFSAVSY
jgi:ubiquinone/menaquinone biosynthesis C-methylase UbiE